LIAQKILEAVREWFLRLCGSFRLRANDKAYRAELAHHLELAEERFRLEGYSPAEAARLARVRYGQPDNAVEELRRQQGIPWFGAFTLDVKLGLRMLRKYIGITLIGGLAMSVGFGICIAVFVYFDVVMWSDSIPLDEGERVVAIQVWDPENSRRSEIGIEDFERWRAELDSLEEIGAFRTVEYGVVHDNGEIESVSVAEISPAGFRLARVSPALGRTLVADDGGIGAEPVIVIGYDEWQSRYEGNVDVLGQTLRLNDVFYTIVGVMPEDFGFPLNHQFWVPLQAPPSEFVWAPPAGAVFARLAAGVTLEQAQAELTATGLLPADSSPARSEPLRPTILQYASNFVSDTDPGDLANRAWNARMVIFFVSLLLVPLCVNIAMLVYARTVTRKEEIAVRTALGASRSRIVLQLFIEMLVLSTIAVSLALVAVSVMVGFVEGLYLRGIGRMPFWLNFGLSIDTLIFAAALAVFAALVIGLLPALGATRSFARPGLNALDPRNQARLGPVWTFLVVMQVAFSFMALPSAVELGWGVLRAHVLGPGFAAEQYLTARISFDTTGFVASDPEIETRFDSARSEFIRTVEADPRIRSRVAAASAVPGEAGQWRRFHIDDHEDDVSRDNERWFVVDAPPPVQLIDIDDAYLEVFDVELLAGRDFDPGEYLSNSQSILINATFANDNFPGANALGRRIRYDFPSSMDARNGEQAERWFEIVGVIADRPAHPYVGSVFHPVDRSVLSPVSIGFRTDIADGQFREDLRDLAARIDPALEVQDIQTLAELYDNQALGNYIGGFAIIVSSICVLALAAAGTYALMSFTVNQRRREIAIRMALGARSQKLLRGIFRRALRQLSIGAGVGLVLAILVQRYVPSTILGGLDVPGVLPGAIALLVAVGLGASFAPARRALRTDPNTCLNDSGVTG
jgi:predicted permease